MKEVNEWVTREQENIEMDPSFWVISQPNASDVYPWEGLRISNDSVWVQLPLAGNDASLVYNIYTCCLNICLSKLHTQHTALGSQVDKQAKKIDITLCQPWVIADVLSTLFHGLLDLFAIVT